MLTSLSFYFQVCPWVFRVKRLAQGCGGVLKARRVASASSTATLWLGMVPLLDTAPGTLSGAPGPFAPQEGWVILIPMSPPCPFLLVSPPLGGIVWSEQIPAPSSPQLCLPQVPALLCSLCGGGCPAGPIIFPH